MPQASSTRSSATTCYLVRCQSMTYLEKDLDTLQWCNRGFCQASCNATRQKLLQVRVCIKHRPVLRLPELNAGDRTTAAVMSNLGKNGQAAQGLLSRRMVRAVLVTNAALLNTSILLRHRNFQHSQPVSEILWRCIWALWLLPLCQ